MSEATIPTNTKTTGQPGKKGRDSVLGWLILLFVGLFFLGIFAFLFYLGHRFFWSKGDQDARSSIAVLSSEETVALVPATEPAGGTPQPSPAPPIVAVDKKTLAVSVLNGGGAKGSAGVLADILKKEGYEKTAVGNTVGNFTGVTIYYSNGNEAAAELLKAVVVKKYPEAKVLPADPKQSETNTKDIVIILGA
mgnify:CR=1 FL=1